ncbi:MAG: hypothetical protein ABGW81_07890 [Paracoccaceae bacterium]
MRRSAKPPYKAPAIEVPEDFELPPIMQWGFTPNLHNSVTEGGMSGEILTGTTLGPHVTLHCDGEGAVF